MSPARHSTASPDIAAALIPEAEHRAFARLAREYAGIKLGPNKRQLLSGRLQRRMRVLGLDSFAAYRRFLQRYMDQELDHFVSAITTNLTSFFREEHHFIWLARHLQGCAAGSSLSIWSAGCATGEEPYSIAMVAHESGAVRRGVQVRILATDIDRACIVAAERGVYDLAAAERLASGRLAAHFLRGKGANEGRIRIRPEVRDLVEFRCLNLLDRWDIPGPIDVVFCRNVVIYFDDDTRRRLFDRIAGVLKPRGLLVIGHSENLQRVSGRFRSIGQTIYRRAD